MEGSKKKLKRLICIFVCVIMFMQIVQMDGMRIYASEKGLNYTSKTLSVGNTLKLKYKGSSQKVKWSSSKPGVAKVSANGKVTALKKGTAVIRAKVGSNQYTCKIKVEKPYMNYKYATVIIDGSMTLRLKGTDRAAKWSSSNSKIVTVSNGEIHGVKEGNARVYAKLDGKKYVCKVKVVKKQDWYADLLYEKINTKRNQYGVPALDRNRYLDKAARVRARELAIKFSTERPNGTSAFSAIHPNYRWKKASQLIARKYVGPNAVLNAWSEDATQKAILLNANRTDVGIGVYLSKRGYLYWCVLEARR